MLYSEFKGGPLSNAHNNNELKKKTPSQQQSCNGEREAEKSEGVGIKNHSFSSIEDGT